MKISIFDTVVLRSLESTDATDLFNTIHSEREYLGQWLPFVSETTAVEVTQQFVDYAVNQPDPTFTIRKEDKLVGLIGFKDSDKRNLKTEIGYWLSEPFQGAGIMTRSVNRLCQYAFNEMNMNRVQIKCAVGNTRSSAIPKRLGFVFEGIERAAEQFPDGRFADIEVYSILKKEFSQQQPTQ